MTNTDKFASDKTLAQVSSLTTERMRTRMGFCLSRFPELRSSAVLDVGCGDGRHLLHFGPESVGLDGRVLDDRPSCKFLQWSFDADISKLLSENGLSPFHYIWCSDVFEHHPSPHLFLLDLRRCLAPDGILLLGVPLVNPVGAISSFKNNKFLNYFRGYLSQDHLNFFNFKSLKYVAEFSGFEVLDWYSPFLKFKRPIMFGFEPITTLVLRATPDFNYGPKAFKRLDKNGYMRWKSLSDYTTEEIPVD